MKAEIDENGLMTIYPETGTEAFAVKQWVSINWVNSQSNASRNKQGHFRWSSIISCAVENTQQRSESSGDWLATKKRL